MQNETRVRRRLAAMMAVDVEGFGWLTEANEEATLAALRRHRHEFIDGVIARHDGRIFKDLGHGLLVELASAVQAVECAVEIQSGMDRRNAGLAEDSHVRFRIGINLGDVIVRGDDFYGDDVNIAARLVGLAQPGGIACSAGIRHQVGAKLGITFKDLGPQALKNITQRVQVFTIDSESGKPGQAPAAVASGSRHHDRVSVGVLPFANMSGDPEQDYFSDGITEDIIIDLAKVSELFVLSRNTVFAHKGRATDMEQAARALGVDYVVHGSVRKAGARVRVTAQLIDGATGGHLWADRYDRDLTDIFALQDEITRTIVDRLKVTLLPGERRAIGQAPTSSVEAYTCFLRGRESFHRGSRADYIAAKAMFARAITLDPRYARAYAGLADCDAFLHMDYSEDVAADVLMNSEKALSLDGDLVEARASRGLALSIARRYAEAEREFAIALARDPDHFELRFFCGRSCYAQGKLDRTVEHWERAAAIKPDDYQALILLHQVHVSLGRLDDAERAARRGIARAEREFARSGDNPRPAYLIATTLAKLGETARAESWAKRALAIAPDDYLTQYNIACFHAVLGQADSAFAILERLLPRSNEEMKDWMLGDSDLASLHGDPRWQRLSRRAAAATG